MTVEMLVWTVIIGMISKEASCEGLPLLGCLLRVFNKLSSAVVVDEDITSLVRCVLNFVDICVLE